MSENQRTRPEALLAQRSLEAGEALREGDLLSEIEIDGDARFVRVRDGQGEVRYTMARLPGSEAPGRLLPEWAPFVPGTECVLSESADVRLVVYAVASGSAHPMRDVAARLGERLEELGIPGPESLRGPDGSIDQDKAAGYAREMKERIPPDVLSELRDAFLGHGVDTEPLDRAWDALRAWFADRDWQVDDRDLEGGLSVRGYRFTRGPERYDATATSLMGTQAIMLSSMRKEEHE